MKGFILDDEKMARENLKMILSESFPEMEIVGESGSPLMAIQTIRNLSFDVLFLDISMPLQDGFEFLEELDTINFEIVFISAYQEYAIEAIKKSAFDYILKPIEPIELVNCLLRLKSKLSDHSPYVTKEELEPLIKKLSTPPSDNEVIVPYAYGYKVLRSDDIALIEGNNNTTKVYLTDDSIMDSSLKIKEFEELLLESSFFRIHKSYLINLNHVKEYNSKRGNYVITTNNIKVDISRKKLTEFHDSLKSHIKKEELK